MYGVTSLVPQRRTAKREPGRESEEKAPPKARVKQSTKGGGDGESSGVERSHGSADFQRWKAGREEVAAMAAQGVDPNPPKDPQPKEVAEEEGV